MSDFITKLSELIDPEVMGDMVSARIPKKLRVAPFAKIDDTLQGVPGDTITVPGKKFRYSGIPTFEPEHFMRVSPKDTMKRKQFIKGTEQIAQEGAIQIFREVGGGMEEVVVGVVGVWAFLALTSSCSGCNEKRGNVDSICLSIVWNYRR